MFLPAVIWVLSETKQPRGPATGTEIFLLQIPDLSASLKGPQLQTPTT